MSRKPTAATIPRPIATRLNGEDRLHSQSTRGPRRLRGARHRVRHHRLPRRCPRLRLPTRRTLDHHRRHHRYHCQTTRTDHLGNEFYSQVPPTTFATNLTNVVDTRPSAVVVRTPVARGTSKEMRRNPFARHPPGLRVDAGLAGFRLPVTSQLRVPTAFGGDGGKPGRRGGAAPRSRGAARWNCFSSHSRHGEALEDLDGADLGVGVVFEDRVKCVAGFGLKDRVAADGLVVARHG